MRTHRLLLGVLGSLLLVLSASAQDCPPPGECVAIQKYCRPECGTKKTTKYVYRCKTEDYCLPKCTCRCALASLFTFCKKDCGGCAPAGCGPACCPQCGKPRTRNILVKVPVKHEEPEMKCVVDQVPVPCVPACAPRTCR